MTPVDHERKDASLPSRKGTREGVWTERVVVCLLVASLAGTLNLIVVLHRRGSKPEPEKPTAPVIVAEDTKPEPKPVVPPPKPRKPPESPKPAPPVEDPTKKALAELEAATAQEIEEIKKADQRTAEMEKGRLAAVAEAQKWRRRETLIKTQVANLAEKSKKIEQQVDEIALERDALARERDALKAALTSTKSNASFAVLPFKGANGTWQRPIVLECSDGTVTLQPRGLSFSMLDLNPHIHPRASIVVQTIARELSVMEAAGSPDGAPVVPYLVFVVRPDGIRPYYEARARLEPLGISFGYELVPQEMKINFPDLADLDTWDGSTPLNVPSHVKNRPVDPSTGGSGPASQPPLGDLAMNGQPGAGLPAKGTAGEAWASGEEAGTGDNPNEYIWPTSPPGGRGSGSGTAYPPSGSPRSGTGGFSPSAPGAGGRAFGTTTAGRNSLGVGGRGTGSGGSRPAGSSGVGGSPGVWATPGDGSSGGGGANPGAGTGGFQSRGTPGGDGNGSEFGFGQLPGANRGGSGQPGGTGTVPGGNPANGDLAGLLERAPDGSSDGLPGSMNGAPGGFSGSANGASGPGMAGGMNRGMAGGNPTGSGTGGGTGLDELAGGYPGSPQTGGMAGGYPGNPQSSGMAGGYPGNPQTGGMAGGYPGNPQSGGMAGGSGTNATQGTQGGASASSKYGDLTSNLNGTGTATGDPSDPNNTNPDSAGQSDPSGGFGGGGNGSQSPSGTMSGLTSSLMPSQSSSGSGAGSSGSSSSSGSTSASGPSFGSPSSSSSSSNASSSGLGFGLPSSLSPSGSASGSPAGSQSSSNDKPKESDDFLDSLPPLPSDKPKEPIKIDAPFEVVIDCQNDGIEILPGGNRITLKTIQAGASTKGEKGQELLARHLRSLERKRAIVDPMIRPRPRVKFIVEAGGDDTYLAVRRQLLFSGLDWPMTVQMVEGHASRFFNREVW